MYMAYVVTVRFVCVHDVNGCAGQCGEVCGGRMRMAEVCGHERGHQRPQYLEVCLICKICYFCMFFSVNMCFVCLCAFTGRLWQCRDVW